MGLTKRHDRGRPAADRRPEEMSNNVGALAGSNSRLRPTWRICAPRVASLARFRSYGSPGHAPVHPGRVGERPCALLKAQFVAAVSHVDPDVLFPSRFPEVANRPNVRALLAEQVDMQMDDIASMLALPRHDLGLSGGCNLALTGLLSNVIAGCSVLLFEASLDSIWGRARFDSGGRFKDLLIEYYPWREDDALTPELAARLIYHEARNPLAHGLGVGKNRVAFPGLPHSEQRAVMLAKRALSVNETEDLLRHPAVRPRVATIRVEPTAWVIDVAALTSGLFVLLHRLLGDTWQSDLAEETARARLTGQMIDYGALPTCDEALGRWGPIEVRDDYRRHLDEHDLIVRVPPANERRRPPTAHDGRCQALDIHLVEQHLRDRQGGHYFWARDLDVARRVFRARRCFSRRHQ